MEECDWMRVMEWRRGWSFVCCVGEMVCESGWMRMKEKMVKMMIIS